MKFRIKMFLLTSSLIILALLEWLTHFLEKTEQVWELLCLPAAGLLILLIGLLRLIRRR